MLPLWHIMIRRARGKRLYLGNLETLVLRDSGDAVKIFGFLKTQEIIPLVNILARSVHPLGETKSILPLKNLLVIAIMEL